MSGERRPVDGPGPTALWFGVRSWLTQGWRPPDSAIDPKQPHTYEERVVLVQAATAEHARRRAAAEAGEYASAIAESPSVVLRTETPRRLPGPPDHGALVFEAQHRSGLPAEKFLDLHFDTGFEHTGILGDEPTPSIGDRWLKQLRDPTSHPEQEWFAVRTFSATVDGDDVCYLERITLWLLPSMADAIGAAETEAAAVAAAAGCTVLGLVQGFELFDDPGDGVEVYSLLRDSGLSPQDYTARLLPT